MIKPTAPEIRFWRKVNKDGPAHPTIPDLGKCWLWTGGKRVRGHGYFRVAGVGTSAHQFSYHFHSCDNGACVNPDHLNVGTHKRNMQEAKERNRMPRGELHSSSIFTEDQVLEIRQLYVDGMRVKEIAEKFATNRSGINHIVHEYRWKHLKSNQTPEKRGHGEHHCCAKLTATDVIEIRRLHKNGLVQRKIAVMFGLTVSGISAIVLGRTWKHLP